MTDNPFRSCDSCLTRGEYRIVPMNGGYIIRNDRDNTYLCDDGDWLPNPDSALPFTRLAQAYHALDPLMAQTSLFAAAHKLGIAETAVRA